MKFKSQFWFYVTMAGVDAHTCTLTGMKGVKVSCYFSF